MADPRDDLSRWLAGRADPLPPPPGTFEEIRRRARRRKYRKLGLGAAAAAMIVAAAVAVPQVVRLPSGSPVTAAPAGRAGSASAPSAPVSGAGSAASASSRPAGTAPVPPGFRPTSVTFVGPDTGWVIGQAGTPGRCATQYCTSVARTSDAGRTWTGVPAPLAGPPDGGTGVSQIRFLNTSDGWAFGPGLYATGDGGQTWTEVGTHGLRVTDLESADGRVFALFASCTGSGTAVASGCTRFTLYSSPADGSDWAPVGAATTGLTDGKPGEAASLLLAGSRGYLLAPGGQLYAGPVTGGPWTLAGSVPRFCPTGVPQPDGQPSGALLGAASSSDLVLACLSPAAGGSGQQKLIFASQDGGASWIQLASAPEPGQATSVAASPADTVVLATTGGLDLLPQGQTRWQAASLSGGGPAGGFGYAGMTNDSQGVALPADPADGTVWFSYDGGQTWAPSRLDGSG